MTEVAVAIIVNESGHVLLCQRPTHKPYAFQWEFPGGKVESDESAEAALHRELREELGIRVAIGDLYHRQQNVYPDSGAYDVLYYSVSSVDGDLTNKVFHDVRWVPIGDLHQYDILAGNRSVIERLVADGARLVARKA